MNAVYVNKTPIVFCSRCHKKVDVRTFMNGNVKIKGNLTIVCPHCGKSKIQIDGDKE